MESGIAQSVVDEMYQQELQFRVGPTYKAGEKLVINPYRINYPQVGRYWSANNIRYKVVKKTDTEREVVAMNLSYAKNSDKNKPCCWSKQKCIQGIKETHHGYDRKECKKHWSKGILRM